MKIYNYRSPNTTSDQPWKDCIFNDNSQLASFSARSLVSFNSQPVLQQHYITYLTGKDSSHAHHFAKMLAAALLNGDYAHAPSISVTQLDNPASILWIDTVRGPHACASFFREMTAGLKTDDRRFHLLCLDMLGSFRENYWELTREVEAHIQHIKPTLVVIDDIDHLMPHSGINVASEFFKIVRDTTNHTETAFLFVGYNHLSKRASTTGDVGKLLFTGSNSVFSVSTQHAVSRVRLVRSHEILSNILDHPDSEFLFSVAANNCLHEVADAKCPNVNVAEGPQPLANGFVTQTTLRDIISEVVQPGETISPDELTAKLTARRQQLNRIDRSRILIAQAIQLGILNKSDGSTSGYMLAPPPTTCKSPDNSTNLTLH